MWRTLPVKADSSLNGHRIVQMPQLAFVQLPVSLMPHEEALLYVEAKCGFC
jgi:hypothetical protein